MDGTPKIMFDANQSLEDAETKKCGGKGHEWMWSERMACPDFRLADPQFSDGVFVFLGWGEATRDYGFWNTGECGKDRSLG
jgi:hypothetical protein